MATLSRTKKYQDLRDRLQNESSVDNFSTTDLSRFEKRLNDLDAQNFSLPDSYMRDTHNATHARSHEVKEVKEEREENPFVGNPDFDTSSYYTNQNNSTFDNDYLDQYIREVKQYNIDQGNAALENTQLNILKQIERNKNPQPTLNRPYYREEELQEETADIPVFSSKTSKLNTVEDFQQPSPVQEDEAGEVVPTQVLSKEDIMAEVQNLVNGDRPPLPQDPTPQLQQTQQPSSSFIDDEFPFDRNMSTDTFNRRMEIERTTRQQLLNETTQMRAQLDDYEDNLSEVSDKMRQTNKILNIVLMILIVFLAVVVGFVIYWIIISK